MATITDIGVAAAINILSALGFLMAFALLRLQPINGRVYFTKWYLNGERSSRTHSGAFIHKFINLNPRSYLRFLEWIPAALKMSELELIEHAGLDSAVFLRIYLIGYSTLDSITFSFSMLLLRCIKSCTIWETIFFFVMYLHKVIYSFLFLKKIYFCILRTIFLLMKFLTNRLASL